AGEGLRKIAGSLGISRNTVREYIRAAESAEIGADRALSADEWVAFVRAHFPGIEDHAARSVWWRDLDGQREEIAKGLETNHVTTVWQRLHAAGKVKASLSTFRRYVRERMPKPIDPREVVVHGPEAEPGESAEVDFGRLGLWTDPASGRRRVLWAFLMVLAHSRHMFVRPVLRMDKRTWLECHVRAFSFFGGVSQRIVLDNLKDGVIKADIYDPRLNRAYAEMGHYYGVLLDPARALHPKDKPHVERMVPFTREHAYRGREERFVDLDAGAEWAERWCLEEAGTRIHRTTRRRPYEAFVEDERPALRPLPEVAWEPYTWEQAKVGADCYCVVASSFYTIPYRFLHQSLDARLGDHQVEFFRGDELVKVHRRVPRGKRQTDDTDLPPDRIAFYQRTPQWCLRRAKELGPAVHAAVLDLLSVRTSAHLRQVHGILRLVDTYGPARLDAACARACDYGDPRYRTVKNILEAGLDEAPSQIQLWATGAKSEAGGFLRGAAVYASSVPGEVT
ncbi:MAG: IS21 family transposase, partial [Trebonia sp.]